MSLYICPLFNAPALAERRLVAYLPSAHVRRRAGRACLDMSVATRGLARQWDAWDAELVNLRAALADDTTKPPPSLKAEPTTPPTPPSFPLPDSGQLHAMRPPLAPEVIAQLDAATAEALGGIGKSLRASDALQPSSSAPDVRLWGDSRPPPRP